MVRCWGGNVYESDAFFDRCDATGVLVWQDFAFACCRYPQNDAFLDRVRIEAESQGFKKEVRVVDHLTGEGTKVSLRLDVGAAMETVTVMASSDSTSDESRQIEKQIAQQQTRPSANVANLQKRVAGVLPIPIDVPKAGNSYRFVRPLVVDEETKVTFTLRNTGKRDGIEIAQVYATLPASAGEPPRRLVAWESVELKAGESKTVTLSIDPLHLSVFNEQKDQWELVAGEYKIWAGPSSRALPLSATVKIAQ